LLERLRLIASTLPRRRKLLLLIAFDAIVLIGVVFVAYRLRLGNEYVPSLTQLWLILAAPLIAIPVFARLGLYRAVIRYLPERTIWTVIKAMSLAAILWMALVFVTAMWGLEGVPRAIPLIYWALGIIVVAGSRFAAKRLLAGRAMVESAGGHVLIYGAGVQGAQLAQALNADGARRVAAFVDDNPALHGRDLSGLRVYPASQAAALVDDLGITEVILADPAIPPDRRQALVGALRAHPIKIRALPPLAELALGSGVAGQLRELDLDDLLGRPPVAADPALFGTIVTGKTIMVTGAGGSIGSELVRLLARWSPRAIVLLEANEFALYTIERYLADRAEFTVVPVLGSVTDEPLVWRAVTQNKVEVVFHAAAHKHVPLVEANALEGIRNNIFGTEAVARVALKEGVERFVLISTDKAVHPSSVMGATKRWAELIVRECGDIANKQQTGQRFTAVRFGNVLGSNGSVVPLFQRQIAEGGPVTLTHRHMTRYFMSIHEAAELIVQAGALSEGGDMFFLEMGEPVKIADLAETMIRLAGLTVRSDDHPDGDIEIELVGSRPGEKLREELFYDPGEVSPTSQPRILRAAEIAPVSRNLREGLTSLAMALGRADEARARDILFGLIAEETSAAVRSAE
jgi:FlaA1/EpsC-like NDP-sugar epimerase